MKIKPFLLVFLIISIILVSGCKVIGKDISHNKKDPTNNIDLRILKQNMEMYESQFENTENMIKIYNYGDKIEYSYPKKQFGETDEILNINFLNIPEFMVGENIGIFVYYEGLNTFNSFIGVYQIEEQLSIDLPITIEEDNFDVIITFSELYNMGSNNGANKVIIVEPFFSESGEVIFNFSELNEIQTNILQYCEGQDLGIMHDQLNLKINSTKTITGISIAGFALYPQFWSFLKEINNFIYVAEDSTNQDWQFTIFNFATTENGNATNITHLALTINDILYENILELGYIVNNLNEMKFEVPIAFENYDFVDIQNHYINTTLLPIKINFLFSDNNFLNTNFVWYYNGMVVNTIKRMVHFEDYYPEYLLRTEPLYIIKKPNLLRLVSEPIPFYETNSFYLSGYLGNDNNIIGGGYPSNFIFNSQLENGYVRIITPLGNEWYSEGNGRNWNILCDQGQVPSINSYFPNMECIEGNYQIYWAFEDIIINRDLYLNSTVYYNGTEFEILNQDLEIKEPGLPAYSKNIN